MAKVKACEYYTSRLPRASIAYFDTGHAFAYTEAAKFNRVVADFVRGA